MGVYLFALICISIKEANTKKIWLHTNSSIGFHLFGRVHATWFLALSVGWSVSEHSIILHFYLSDGEGFLRRFGAFFLC